MPRKIALVVGGSFNVWRDVKRAQRLMVEATGRDFDAVYCVKQIGIYWPTKFDVWVTLHPEKMDEYEAARKALGFVDGYEIVCHLAEECGDHGAKGRISRRTSFVYQSKGRTGHDPATAGSGMFGAKVAVEDGYFAVLAGIPMSKDVGHFLPGTKTINEREVKSAVAWNERDAFMIGYEQYKAHLSRKVKSVSGTTLKDFGEPTPAWLRGDPAPGNSTEVQAGCLA